MTQAAAISARRFLLAGLSVAFLAAGCAAAEGPGWTFAPLGPTPPAAETPAESPGTGETPGPGETPGTGETPAAGTVVEVATPGDRPLEFEPDQLSAAPATEVTVEYLNESNLPHNIHFFVGPDASAESLAATEVVTGPGALESVTFTTPDEPGQYFFHCDVHPVQMIGTLDVAP